MLPADLTDPAQLATVEDRCRDPRAVDVLVNNAGFGTFGAFHTLDVDTEIARDPAQRGRARAAHARGRGARWSSAGRGGILNVSSLAGFQPGPMNATYSATKAFVTSFTEAVHEELKGTGVSVTRAVPGLHAHRVPGARRTCRPSDVPGFMWQEADEVARGRPRRRSRRTGGRDPRRASTRCSGTFSSVTPHAITRRLSGAVVKRTATD